MQTNDSTVRLQNISKKFGSVVAVEDFDIFIEPGQFVTLLGPSGCGKSTTLRILGGFIEPTEGEVFLGDDKVTKIPPNRRNVNMVFQDYALFPHMTVSENIAFGLEMKGQNKAQIKKRIDELLEFMQLDGFGDRKPDELSGGQRQRVALARALAPDPKVLLLDEPLGALDAKLRKQVQIELKTIQQQTGKTFVFVTHDQEEALTMSDRILVMNEGRLEQDGSPKDLYYHPETTFVAGFIGETNMLSCSVKKIDDDYVVLDWQGNELRGICRSGTAKTAQEVSAAIRPESISCFAKDPGDKGAMKAKIIHRVFKGSFTSLSLEVEGVKDCILNATLAGALAEQLGDEEVWITLDPDYLSVLLR